VDEVLAVGDAEFQKKCLGKMGDVASNEGRTILFVSHNMAAVTMLCEKSILINQGKIIRKDKTSEVIINYSQLNRLPNNINNTKNLGEFYNFHHVPKTLKPDSKMIFSIQLINNQELSDFKIFFIINDSNSTTLVHSVIPEDSSKIKLFPGKYLITLELPPIWFKPGNYSVFFKLVSFEGKKTRIVSNIELLEINYFEINENLQGIINPKISWEIVQNN